MDSSERVRFEQLANLREYLRPLLDDADRSIAMFHAKGTGGFIYRLDPAEEPGLWSMSSTATCVEFLRATDRLDDDPWGSERQTLIDEIVKSDWDAAKLGPNNTYAISFLLEALATLGGREVLTPAQRNVVNGKLRILRDEIRRGGGRLRLLTYGPSSFLTFKAVNAMRRWGRLNAVRDLVEAANWNHFYMSSALLAAGSADADVFELAYAVLIASAVAPLDRMTPQQRTLLRHGLDQFFETQLPDGTWPRSRPLFAYPGLGYAYCFDPEFLAALLTDEQLGSSVHDRLDELGRGAAALDARKYPLVGEAENGAPDNGKSAPSGWSSGHHGADERAESWATAASLHFCFMLDRVVAEGIRRLTFHYARERYAPPATKPGRTPYLPKKFLDSALRPGTATPGSLKKIVTEFIEPLVAARGDLEHGKALRKDIQTSAILYGPPGTSKTELAKYIARALGWPLLSLDPSHLTRHGLDEVHAEANTLFEMLGQCEQVVLFLDEFDELVREREVGELQSRFLTTAMLPKLAALSRERRIVYLVATNHIEVFDVAIRRQGRFDRIIPVMVPTLKAKRQHWKRFAEVLDRLEKEDEGAAEAARETLADLTYLEARELHERLGPSPDMASVRELFEEFRTHATLTQRVAPQGLGSTDTWKERIAQLQEQYPSVVS